MEARRASRWVEPLALVSLALLVRVPGLDRRPLWLDEACNVLFARRGLLEVLDAVRWEGNPPLYYWLLGLWTEVLGDSEWAVRALPLLFGVLSVVSTWRTARALFPGSRHAAWIAGLLVALSPLHAYYSREGRVYTLTTLVASELLLALHRALDRGVWRDWLRVSAWLVTGLYAHNYALFLLPVVPLTALVTVPADQRRRALVGAVASVATAALVYLPWVPTLLFQLQSGVGSWVGRLFSLVPAWRHPFASMEAMGVGGVFPPYLGELSQLPEGLSLGSASWSVLRWTGVALLTLGLGSVAVSRRALSAVGPSITRVALFGLLPLAIPYVWSLLASPIYLVGRYELPSLVALALLLGASADMQLRSSSVTRRRATGAVLALWVVAAALVLIALHRAPVSLLERTVARILVDHATAADVIVFPDTTRAVPEYYLGRASNAAARVSFPPEQSAHPGWIDPHARLSEPAELVETAQRTARRLREHVEVSGGTVYVVDWNRQPPLPALNVVLHRALQAELGPESIAFMPHPHAGPYLTLFAPRQNRDGLPR